MVFSLQGHRPPSQRCRQSAGWISFSMKLSKIIFYRVIRFERAFKQISILKFSCHMILVVYITFPFWQHTSTEGLLRRGVITAERFTPIYLLAETKDKRTYDRYWWQAKDFHIYDDKIGSRALCEESRNTFLAWNVLMCFIRWTLATCCPKGHQGRMRWGVKCIQRLKSEAFETDIILQ